MNKDQIKGKAKSIVGNIEEQAGYWSDDKKTEAKGVLLQVKGKTQEAYGDVKEAVGNAIENIKAKKDVATTDTTKSKRKSA